MIKYIILLSLIPSLVFADRSFFDFASTTTVTSLTNTVNTMSSTVNTMGVTVSTNTANITKAAKDKITFGIGDGTNVITTGLKKVISVPYDCTITGWTLLSDDPSDTAGAIVIDIFKSTYGGYPPTSSIINTGAGGVKPTITATATKGVSSSVANWTTAITAGDVLRFNVDSVTSLKSVTLVLACSK